jgi:signal transduction histidine kinase
MRSPLNTIVMTASYLSALNAGTEVTEAAKLLIRSGASIQGLVDDLVDFNRTKLGLGIFSSCCGIWSATPLSMGLRILRSACRCRENRSPCAYKWPTMASGWSRHRWRSYSTR